MIYLKLFLEFLKVGLFTFGGAYGAIPLIEETVLSNGWMTDEMFTNMIAVSESTPGPIMVNAATYVGNTNAGLAGAVCSTFGVVLPSFVIILMISRIMTGFVEKPAVKRILGGVKPAIVGMIIATGIYLGIAAVIGSAAKPVFDMRAMIIILLLTAVSLAYQKIKKKPFSPILLICLAAVLGIAVY